MVNPLKKLTEQWHPNYLAIIKLIFVEFARLACTLFITCVGSVTEYWTYSEYTCVSLRWGYHSVLNTNTLTPQAKTLKVIPLTPPILPTCPPSTWLSYLINAISPSRDQVAKSQ